MPGNRLSKTEKDLDSWWNKSTKFKFPVLRSVTVEGDSGLRGIKNLTIDFDYPITAICGQNGSGKTTMLALASLAYHPPSGHHCRNAKKKRGKDRSHYTFSDFFYKGPSDPDISGVAISWNFSDNNILKIQKGIKKWMRYERRPERPVHYLGVSRCIPAIEQNVLRVHFKSKSKNPTVPLSSAYLKRLGKIMGRTYAEVSESSSESYRLRECNSGSRYSGFNMGSGEDILAELLLQLQEIPDGSLIVIEEIEIGLHPRALTLLAQQLQEIALEKKLQIIVSTHSAEFIDALPRAARLLIQRESDAHNVLKSPTTKYAMSAIGAKNESELVVYCEDEMAEAIIKQSVDGNQRKRIKIVPVGSDSQLASQAASHLVSGNRQLILIVWDGDVNSEKCKSFLDKAQQEKTYLKQQDMKRINWIALPGGLAPEEWILETLASTKGDGSKHLGSELRIDEDQARALISNLDATCASDCHKLPSEVSQKMSIDKSEATSALVRATIATAPNKFCELREAINIVLSGRKYPVPESEHET